MERRSPPVDEAPTTVLPARARMPTDVSRLPTLPMPAVKPPPPPHKPSIPARILDVFVTKPSSGQSDAYIDGLRALAALSVVLLHTWSESPGATVMLPIPFTDMSLDYTPLLKQGGLGVYLFFILSGFLLAQPWIEANYRRTPSPNLKHYFTLRLTRIAPAYYTALFIVVILFTPSFVPASLVYSRIGVFTVAAHLLFLHFLFPVSSTSFRIGGQFWSLTIEMLFYLLLPLVVRAFYGRRWMVALPIGALISLLWLGIVPRILPVLVPEVLHLTTAIGARWYTAYDASFYIQNQLPAHAFEFALGMTLANLYVRRRLGYASHTMAGRALDVLTHRRTGTSVFLVGSGLILLTIYQTSYGMPLIHVNGVVYTINPTLGWRTELLIAQYREFIVSVGFGLIVFGASYGVRGIRAILGWTPLRIMGIVSYSIYLLHMPLLNNVMRLYPLALHQAPNTLFAEYLFTLLAQMVPLAIVLYLIVERPAMRWARQRVRATQAT